MSKIARFSAFFILLIIGTFCEAASVKGVRMSEVGHQTRVTFVLNEPLSLDLEEDPENNRISVRAPHGTLWATKNVEKTIGFVTGYKTTHPSNDRPVFTLEVLSGTDIDDYGLRRNSQGQPEFFLDLRRELSDTSIEMPPQEKALPLPGASQEGAPVEKEVPEKEGDSLKTETVVQPLKKVRIEKEGSSTILVLETLHPITFEPDLQQAKKKVSISLPKTNWLHVDTKQKQGGVIQGYYVDDSHPDLSNIVISLKDNADMTIHAPHQLSTHHEYRISFAPGTDANEEIDKAEEEVATVKNTSKRHKGRLPELTGKSVPTQDVIRAPMPKGHSDPLPRKSSAVPLTEEMPPQKPKPRANYFRIEGEEECLHKDELEEDLKGLQISLSMPDEMALVDPKDLKKNNLKEEPPKVLKKFKIAPAPGYVDNADSKPVSKHLPLSNAGTMFTRLQKMKDAQTSGEGHAPAWVIEAKMKQKKD